MSDSSKEGLFKRWSRLKRQSAADSAADGVAPGRVAPESTGTGSATELTAAGTSNSVAADATGDKRSAERSSEPSLELPSIDALGPESDFSAFMDPSVDDDLRRAALKALFRDPDFNITDGLDVYAEDYTKLEKLTPTMVAALRYAQRTLFGQDDERDVEQAQADDVQSADVGSTVAAETRGADQTAEVPTKPDSNDLDKAESEMSAAHAQQPLSESPHTRSDER